MSHRTPIIASLNPNPFNTVDARFFAVAPPTASYASRASANRRAAPSSPLAMASVASSIASLAAITCVILDIASSSTVIVDPLTAVCSNTPTAAPRATRAYPSDTSRRPERHFTSVLFPAPFAPTRPHISLGSIRTGVSPSCAPRMRSFAPVVTRTSGEKTTAAPAVSPNGTSGAASCSFDARAVRRGRGRDGEGRDDARARASSREVRARGTGANAMTRADVWM